MNLRWPVQALREELGVTANDFKLTGTLVVTAYDLKHLALSWFVDGLWPATVWRHYKNFIDTLDTVLQVQAQLKEGVMSWDYPLVL